MTTATVFAALGDDSRLALLTALAQASAGASATALAAPLPVTRQAVERHLRVLERAGLVTSARHGREVRFTIRPDALTESAHWLERTAAQWDRRLAVIERRAERPESG